MKKIFKKNQVIITALAIMIAVAGYLNFTKDSSKDEADLANKVDKTIEGSTGKSGDEFADISDEDALDVSDVGEVLLPNGQKTETDKEANAGKDNLALANGDSGKSNPGEAVLASTTINSGFFSSTKLAREQVRAKNKEMLMDIVENTDVTEAQKQAALDNILAMTEVAETENATELLLEAKGFDGVVVSIVDNTVDVVVNAEAITEQQVAQIEDIVMRKTGLSAECIVISPVIMEE